ncbi:V-type proton ATPase subunit G3 [Punica granatum]|uniref:V-type proton ATPase subunit G n=1 Tax=Punica granatum TaxID=22663 RepID=A0A6P8CS48_PUNGR|nr:V-type proton ATPase subunit G3 [Punica granatum]
MDSIKGQGGIQMLLTAEQEAQHIVSSARNLKIGGLKQAKEEAEKEVALYRSKLDTQYQKNLSETGGSSGAKRLEEETEMRIKNLKESASRVSPDIVEMVIKYVRTVKT